MSKARNDSAPPLAGVRILDFTQNLPGPYATMLLASLGAEVIKVEPPKGDTARSVGRFFELVNGGKKSLVVDLKDPSARIRLAGLMASVDVVIEGFRPGVMDDFGFGHAAVRAEHPRIVYCSISGYGQSGPYRDRPSHDINLQALTGACDLGRDDEDKPRGGALPVADLSSSMTSALAIVAALHARERTGEGRFIDVALSDTVHSWSHVWGEGLTPSKLELGNALPGVAKQLTKRTRAGWARGIARAFTDERTRALATRIGDGVRESDFVRGLERLRLHNLPHYGVFRCKDDEWLCVGIVDEDKFWLALCTSIGLGELGRIPLAGRFVMGSRLRPLVAAAIARKTRDEWLAELDLDAVPVSPVLRVGEALTDPQLAWRRPNGAGPAVPPPLADVVDARPPKLGEHTSELLGIAARHGHRDGRP
jgi:crotonobetainyl-CoA:carnitine CoA-transferase CaiB-like acyl-CoA transferase